MKTIVLREEDWEKLSRFLKSLGGFVNKQEQINYREALSIKPVEEPEYSENCKGIMDCTCELDDVTPREDCPQHKREDEK